MTTIRIVMWAHGVGIARPFLQRQTRLHQRRKQRLVQELISQATIEPFDAGVLHSGTSIPQQTRFRILGIDDDCTRYCLAAIADVCCPAAESRASSIV